MKKILIVITFLLLLIGCDKQTSWNICNDVGYYDIENKVCITELPTVEVEVEKEVIVEVGVNYEARAAKYEDDLYDFMISQGYNEENIRSFRVTTTVPHKITEEVLYVVAIMNEENNMSNEELREQWNSDIELIKEWSLYNGVPIMNIAIGYGEEFAVHSILFNDSSTTLD